MLTDDLNSGLARPSTPRIDHELRLMAIEAELSVKPPLWARLGRRGIAVGALVVLLAGGATTAATAGPAPWEWLPWVPDASTTITLPSGQVCSSGFRVMSGASPAAVADAREFLRTLDLSTVDFSTRLTENMAAGSTDENGARRAPVATRERAAFTTTVAELVQQHVKADGFGPVTMEGAGSCE